MKRQNATAAEPHDFQKRCSDQHRNSGVVGQRPVFALDEDVLTGRPSRSRDTETETFPMPARRELDWPEFCLVAD